jgi:hypothetical protein
VAYLECLSIADIQGIIFVIDGVLEFQDNVIPGATETLAQLRAREISLRLLTNSTLKSRMTCTQKLSRSDFETYPELSSRGRGGRRRQDIIEAPGRAVHLVRRAVAQHLEPCVPRF